MNYPQPGKSQQNLQYQGYPQQGVQGYPPQANFPAYYQQNAQFQPPQQQQQQQLHYSLPAIQQYNQIGQMGPYSPQQQQQQQLSYINSPQYILSQPQQQSHLNDGVTAGSSSACPSSTPSSTSSFQMAQSQNPSPAPSQYPPSSAVVLNANYAEQKSYPNYGTAASSSSSSSSVSMREQSQGLSPSSSSSSSSYSYSSAAPQPSPSPAVVITTNNNSSSSNSNADLKRTKQQQPQQAADGSERKGGKKVRIRVVFRDPCIQIKDPIIAEEECKSVESIKRNMSEYFESRELGPAAQFEVKIRKPRSNEYVSVASDAALREYLESEKIPMVVFQEMRRQETFITMEDAIGAIRTRATRERALMMLREREQAERIVEILRSDRFSPRLEKIVKGVMRRMDNENDSDDDEKDDDDDDDSDSYGSGYGHGHGGNGRSRSFNIVRDECSSSDEEEDEEVYGNGIDGKVKKVVEATANALSKKEAYELLKTSGFDVQKALDKYIGGDCYY